jgi:methionine--tRNA ligase beta chain
MEEITFEEFQKIELVTAEILKAEKVEGSEKLLKLEIDLGSEKRQIVAGIAKFYNPEELIGKEIIIVKNLKPRKIFGLESKGMLLAANKNGEPILLTTDKKAGKGVLVS